MGGRDSPRPNVVAPGDETWTTVGRGPKNVSVDPKKFQNIKVIYLLLVVYQMQFSSLFSVFILISNSKKKSVHNVITVI